ncbi:MAG: type II secretion system F family protein, partial [Sutterella sp.]|nr:type II secretion system F family protein [Sutterella sp.]
MNLNAEIRLPADIERKLARLAFGSKTRERCWRKLATHQRHRMPIDESLRLFTKQARAAGSLSTQCYAVMRDRLSAGKGMSEALTGLATPEEILLIHSSQIGGKLSEGLLLAADLLAAKRKVIGAVIGAVAYPAFLFVLVNVVLYAMSVVIIPQLT